jgi:hypothetical protein
MSRGRGSLNRLIASLKMFCERYPFQRKVLLAPSYRAGNELLEALARDAGFVNLGAETIDGLASQAAAVYLARHGIEPLSAGQAAIAFENVYRRLDESGALAYFSKRGVADGLIDAIASAMQELRSCGITGESIDADSFVSPEKGRDIRQLLCAYERCLQENGYVDPPGLLAIASGLPDDTGADTGAAYYLLPPFLRLSPLEAQFIKKRIPAERLFLLYDEPLPDMTPPPGTAAVLFSGEAQLLAQDPGDSPGSGDHTGGVDVGGVDALAADLAIFHAYGVTNEAREVLRRITGMRVPLDTVTVAYTGSEYVPVFHSLCKRYGIPLTAAEGIPVSLTRPGKALKGIIEWVGSDFAANGFRQLLIEGNIELPLVRGVPGSGDPDEEVADNRDLDKGDLDRGDRQALSLDAAELLRASGIGWGRERYSLLAAYAGSIGEEIAGLEEGDHRQGQLRHRIELAMMLDDDMQDILSLIPGPDASGRVEFGSLLRAVFLVLGRLARAEDGVDRQARDSILSHLSGLHKLCSFSLEFEEALDRVAGIADTLSVGASSPEPGALYLAPYRSLHWTGRPCTFVAGLDANSWPGSVAQDPVLLDGERRRLHPELPLGCDRPRLRQYKMLTALRSRRGRLILSYPSFDVVENREGLASSVLLQAFRRMQGNLSLDYSDLAHWLGSPAGYCPPGEGLVLDETEWWLEQVLVGGLANGSALARRCYRSVDRGWAALAARQAGMPTEYDGVVSAAGDDLRRRDRITLSCSRIEYLAACPFAYFLKYVLHLKPPEEVDYDPDRWLDPLQRGLLLHELYCKFMKEIAARKQRVSAAAHKDLLYEMAGELIAGYREATPPPGEVVFDREVRDIRDSCDIFLAAEENAPGSMPLFFEVPFGMPFGTPEEPDQEMGSRHPVRIDLGPGPSFSLRGQIDRIDRLGEDAYCIWDYKTGSSRHYGDHEYLCKGRQVQHALYAIAAEKLIRDRLGGRPRVERSGYYFPSNKGGGRRVERDESDRSKIAALMAHLFDILHGGVFVAADDGEACSYCDYAEACDPERAVPRARALVADAANSVLDPWRRLKTIG